MSAQTTRQAAAAQRHHTIFTAPFAYVCYAALGFLAVIALLGFGVNALAVR